MDTPTFGVVTTLTCATVITEYTNMIIYIYINILTTYMYTYSHTYLNDSQKYPSFVCIFLCIPPLNIFPFILFGVSQLMLCPEIIFGCATFHMQITQHKMICCFFITYWYAYRHFSLLLSWTIIQKYCLYVWNLISIYICMYFTYEKSLFWVLLSLQTNVSTGNDELSLTTD